MAKTDNPKRNLRIFISFVLYILNFVSFFVLLELEASGTFSIGLWDMPDGSVTNIPWSMTITFFVTIISLVVFIVSMFQEWRAGVFKRPRQA